MYKYRDMIICLHNYGVHMLIYHKGFTLLFSYALGTHILDYQAFRMCVLPSAQCPASDKLL